jgi:hypothetical protein
MNNRLEDLIMNKMEQFFIDRQFGQPILIDVENGIVKKCYNDSTLEARMNELYAGKTINFLNEDFIGRAMKGTYHHLRPMATYDAHQKINSARSHKRVIGILMSDYNYPTEKRAELKRTWDEVIVAESMAESLLKVETIRIFNEHNFVI